MTNLLHAHCQRAVEAMSEADVRHHVEQLSGWQVADGALEKTFAFRDYHETIAFVNALAWVAHTEDHHPDLRVGYDRCVVRYSTHSAGGITRNDFICATKADALVSFVA